MYNTARRFKYETFQSTVSVNDRVRLSIIMSQRDTCRKNWDLLINFLQDVLF